MSAAGLYVPRFIIFPGKRLRNVDIEGFQDAIFGASENGWINSKLFKKNVNVMRPVILFVDGHVSHVTLPAARFCKDRNIILYSLHPHASHLHQPCDLSLFSSMKHVWKEEVKKWHQDNLGESLSKKSFTEVFHKTWVRSATPENAKQGFKKQVLYLSTQMQ